MAKAGGSLPRGRRRREEVPPVPANERPGTVESKAQSALRGLVERSGGRFDTQPIEVGQLDTLADLFNEWAREHGTVTEYGIFFAGRPGLWHALDQLYPLQDPNRWDRLRLAIISELERGSWTRRSPPRGSAFEIHMAGDRSQAGQERRQ